VNVCVSFSYCVMPERKITLQLLHEIDSSCTQLCSIGRFPVHVYDTHCAVKNSRIREELK
jgi:hypothetical protein